MAGVDGLLILVNNAAVLRDNLLPKMSDDHSDAGSRRALGARMPPTTVTEEIT